MIDPRNLLNLTGGVVTDVELVNDKIAKFRLAVDYAGSEKGSDNTSGYFDVVYYLKDQSGFTSKNATFIHGQVKADKIKKGAKLQIVGRLVQERWKQDDQNKNRVVVVAEHISYAATAGAQGAKTASTGTSSETETQNSVPDSF
jgi:hypothetical protein